MQSIEGQDWVVVKGKKANRRSQGLQHFNHTVSPSSAALTESEREQWTAQLDASRARVLESRFYAELRRALERQSQLVASLQQVELWGLGSLRQPRAAHIRAQLGLVCLLSKLVFPKLSQPVTAIDPAFTPADIQFLNTLDIQVRDIRPPIARVPTFFFLAHCGISVTEALLAVNATAGTLHNVVLLGNSLERLWDSWRFVGRDADESSGGAMPETIARLMQPGSELVMTPVPEQEFPVTSAFNDLALHIFDQHC